MMMMRVKELLHLLRREEHVAPPYDHHRKAYQTDFEESQANIRLILQC